jgi:hypothetical protein
MDVRGVRTYNNPMSGVDDSAHNGPIRQNQGVTPAERYLKALSGRTFLSLWRYPGLYREPGKELCDLLVVFERDIFIFSDKHCAFPDTGDLRRDSARWFRRAVEASLRQALGAERWIRSYPDRLFLDAQCKQRFPLEIPGTGDVRFHLVVVAHDVARRCAEVLGGSGSLMIRSDLKGLESHTEPFTVGDLNPAGSFVHVFDDTSLEILLKARDTVSDFAAYLLKKESLLRSAQQVFAAGEEELLAVYLRNMKTANEHDFVFPPDVTGIWVAEGHWEDFQRNRQRRAQVEADGISYMWDALIEQFNHHALAGTQFYTSPPGVSSTERILRFMAREPRTRRRMLAKCLAEMLDTTPAHMVRTRLVEPSAPGDPYYVFILFPRQSDRPYDEYRDVRRGYLDAVCRVAKHKCPDALDIVGIATESGMDGERSEDALYLDARVWTQEMDAEAAALQQDLRILTRPIQQKGVEKEYPDVAP